MGGLTIETHWQWLVLPTVREFLAAEDRLSGTLGVQDADVARHAAYESLRQGMASAIFLYHFAEVVMERKALTPQPANRHEARATISGVVVGANGDSRPDDHKILGEVADAIKHAELTSPGIVHVAKTGRVIEISHDAPTIYPDEGKVSGVPQIVISTAAGSRSLRAIISNIGRGWTALLGLTPI